MRTTAGRGEDGEERLAHALAALGYCALTLLAFRTGWRLLATHISPDAGDPLYLLYVLKWGLHQLQGGLPDYRAFWDAPFFFPTRATLTFSEHMIGPIAMAKALSPLVPSPIVLFNLILLGSFAASGWTTWYVLQRSGLPPAAAFLGGAMFAFSPFRWGQLGHLQVLLTAFLPLVLWTWDRLLERPGGRRAAVFFLVYVLHVTGGTYLAYMVHVPLAVIAAVRLPRLRREGRLAAALPWLAATAAACGLVLVPIFLPYLETSRALGLARSPLEFQTWGTTLLSFVTPSSYNSYQGLVPVAWRRPENALFAGFLPTALALAAAVGGWRRLRRRPARSLSLPRRALIAVLAALGIAGFLWAEWKTLGAAKILPALHSGEDYLYEVPLLLVLAGTAALVLRRLWGGNWPLALADTGWDAGTRYPPPVRAHGPDSGRDTGGPREGLDPWSLGVALSGYSCLLLSFPLFFQPASGWVPGLSGMRVPSRFYAFVSFALCYFAARALAGLLARMRSPGRRALATGAVGALLLVDLAPVSLPWVRVPREAELPPVYAWLAGRDGVRALLELPFGDSLTEVSSMYRGTRHWKPLVNGYSGYFPRPYEELRRTCCSPLPEGEALDRLRRWGVTHLLVHRRDLREPWQRRALRRWEAEAPVRLEYAVAGDRVYRLLSGPDAAAGGGPGARPARARGLPLGLAPGAIESPP